MTTGGVLVSQADLATPAAALVGPPLVRVAGVLPIQNATGLAVAPSGPVLPGRALATTSR